MSIATYSDLKTAVAIYSNRNDLTAFIPDFITQAHALIHFGAREPQFASEPLRIRAMETSSDVAISAQTAALPTNYLQSRRFYINSNPIGELAYVVPDVFWRTYISSDSAQPRRFTVEGENFVFGPIPDGSYTGKILYYKKLSAMSGDTDTNWLLTNAPQAYVQGALIYLWQYVFDAEKEMLAKQRFSGIINGLNLADKSDRYSGSPWQAVGDTGNP